MNEWTDSIKIDLTVLCFIFDFFAKRKKIEKIILISMHSLTHSASK